MLILHLWRAARTGAVAGARARLALAARLRRAARSRRARAALATLDRRVLADIGIGPGAIVSLARDIGVERLRRPPHV
jgi:uncharacterized protein YjiS (DUF1127 family)